MPDTALRACTIPVYTHQRGTFIPIGRCGRPANHTITGPVAGHCCDRHTALLTGLYPLQPIGANP